MNRASNIAAILADTGNEEASLKLASADPRMMAEWFKDHRPTRAGIRWMFASGSIPLLEVASRKGLITPAIYYENLLETLQQGSQRAVDWILQNRPTIPSTITRTIGGRTKKIVDVRRRVIPKSPPLLDAKNSNLYRSMGGLDEITRLLSPERRVILFSVWNPRDVYTVRDIGSYVRNLLTSHRAEDGTLRNTREAVFAEANRLADIAELTLKDVMAPFIFERLAEGGAVNFVHWLTEYFGVGYLGDLARNPGAIFGEVVHLAGEVVERNEKLLLDDPVSYSAGLPESFVYLSALRQLISPETEFGPFIEEPWGHGLEESQNGILGVLVWMLREIQPDIPPTRVAEILREAYAAHPMLEEFLAIDF